MPDIVIKQSMTQDFRQEYSRSEDPTLGLPAVIEEDADDGLLPDMMNIDGRSIEVEEEFREHVTPPIISCHQ